MADVDEKSFEMEDTASFVEQELEALQSIYINEIEVNKDEEKFTSVSMDIHPATADNLDEQYVRMTLKFRLSEEYPQAVPDISIRNPRGLSEEILNSLMQHLTSIAESKMGSSMLFEIIEAAKEHLTNENRPCGECAICLYGFSDDDVFFKTECYHYFHSHCLARYVKNAANAENDDEDTLNDTSSDKKILCPMCRWEIHFEGSEEIYPPPSGKDDEFVMDEEVVALQKKMADLYQKQLEKGGIIDIEAEKNKYLLEISNAPTRPNTIEKLSRGSMIDEIDSIPEGDSSKIDEGSFGDTQSLPKIKASGSKDTRAESKNKDRFDNRPRNDRYGHNKQSRNYANHGNPSRGNQRYNRYSKSNYQNFNRKNDGFGAEDLNYRDEQYTDEENSSPQNKHKNLEDYSEDSHDVSPVSESSPGFRSSNRQRMNTRSNFSDSKKYYNDRKGSDYRPNSNRGRRYGPNDYQKQGYRNNQQETKGSPLKNDSSNKNIQNEEVISSEISVSDSNIRENSSESVSEQTTTSTLTEKPEGDSKNYHKTQENRSKNLDVHSRKNSYRNCDSEAYYPEDNTLSQEGRKKSYRRGKPRGGYRNDYNDRHSYRENNYHSQGNRYSQENSHRRNFNQQSRQGDRHSQEKNFYTYEDRRNFNKNRSTDQSAHESSNRKFSSNDRYEYHERESNPQGNISRKPYRNYREEQFDDSESNYMEKGNRYSGRNRNNFHYQNRDQNSRGRNNRSDHYSSYQNNRNTNRHNTPRKYSDSDNHYCKADERTTSDSQLSPEKPFSNSLSEKVSVPKTDVSRKLVSEIPFKETNVPDVKMPAADTSEVIPQKMPRPPPGFSNPSKKVVYGLQAANPPPGFPRS